MKRKKHSPQAVESKAHVYFSGPMAKRIKQVFIIVNLAFAFYYFLSLVSYHSFDPGWMSTGAGHKIANIGGHFGAFLADISLTLFGVSAYLIPVLWMGILTINLQKQTAAPDYLLQAISTLTILAACSILSQLFIAWPWRLPASAGGIVGDLISRWCLPKFNITGSLVFAIALLLSALTILADIPWYRICKILSTVLYQQGLAFFRQLFRPASRNKPELISAGKLRTNVTPKQKTTTTMANISPASVAGVPSIQILETRDQKAALPFKTIDFASLSNLVEKCLAEFNVNAKVVDVHPGPVITRFELDLAAGVKVSKIVGLAKDIARALSLPSVRIVEVIPGKSFIGLEIPNDNRDLVGLKEILDTSHYQALKSPLSLALGKDIAGEVVIADLSKMPHLLVAGTTGSGKSVSVNTMLLSMLFKATPDQLRLILIDPKMLELSVYDGIPHLLTPVITDMKDAANALRWCVAEMDRRYQLMAALGVRNLSSYQEKLATAAATAPLILPAGLSTEEHQPYPALPYIVVVIDELADMMMVVGKKVEELIARLAQKARAAGIHLILATQRPSVDVITGLIKANIPTRIAFQVSSRIDSRTILDQQGAEQLLGHGDMLYLPPGAGIPVRIHGAFVADEEVHRLVSAWRALGEPSYIDQLVTSDIAIDNSQIGLDQDPLYNEAWEIVVKSRKASISFIQRRLRIGYNRAARLMEELEMAGVVSAMDKTGAREILIPETVGE